MPVRILLVSGKSGIDDKTTSLEAGVDGYLTKPFDRYELAANLEAIIRRTHGHSSATVNVGNLIIGLSLNFAKIGDTGFDLTAKEFRIIEFLALRKGAVLSKDAFLSHLYGGIDETNQKSLMSSCANCAAKLPMPVRVVW